MIITETIKVSRIAKIVKKKNNQKLLHKVTLNVLNPLSDFLKYRQRT